MYLPIINANFVGINFVNYFYYYDFFSECKNKSGSPCCFEKA
jgi:hypothetical protein